MTKLIADPKTVLVRVVDKLGTSPVSKDTPSVLPDEVRRLPLAEKLQRLKMLDPAAIKAVEVLVTAALEVRWRAEFYSGPKGGRRLKSVPFVKGGA